MEDVFVVTCLDGVDEGNEHPAELAFILEVRPLARDVAPEVAPCAPVQDEEDVVGVLEARGS